METLETLVISWVFCDGSGYTYGRGAQGRNTRAGRERVSWVSRKHGRYTRPALRGADEEESSDSDSDDNGGDGGGEEGGGGGEPSRRGAATPSKKSRPAAQPEPAPAPAAAARVGRGKRKQ